MLETHRSRTSINRQRSILAERSMSVDDLTDAADRDKARLAALRDDDRLFPLGDIGMLCNSLSLSIDTLGQFEPEPAPLPDLSGRDLPVWNDRVAVAIRDLGNLGHVFAGLLSSRAEKLRVRGPCVDPAAR